MKKVYQEKLNRALPSTIVTTATDTNSVAEAMTGVRNLLNNEKDMMICSINCGWKKPDLSKRSCDTVTCTRR